MRDLPRQTRLCHVAVLALVLTAIAHAAAFADESVRHSPFGILEREGFPALDPLGTAEHQALLAPPTETATDMLGEQSMPSDVVFAKPALPTSQEIIAAPAIMAPSAPLTAPQFDTIVFGPPSAQPDQDQASHALTNASSASPSSLIEAKSVPALTGEEIARLKARARELLSDGSVAAARALLEDAASGGDAESKYLLARTYDPQALKRLGVIGVTGDVEIAEAFYRAAQVGGFPRPDDNARASQR